MKNQIVYEWVIEESDEDGDIQNVSYAQTFAEAWAERQWLLDAAESQREREFFSLDQLLLEDYTVDVASKRLVGNKRDGLIYWGYAYVDFENQTIDEEYCSGERVPQHVTKQIEKWKKTSSQHLRGA